MDTHVLHFAAPPQPKATSAHSLLAGYGLLVLVVATIFSALDRQILTLLAEPMRHSLGLSDTRLGLLQGVGITLFAGVAAVPLGWLADRYGRRTLLAVCVLVWTAATAACGLATDFTALFLAAIGLGIGEAGLAPIVYGLIPEIVPERRRVLANGIYTLAAILGSGLGMSLSGALVEALDSVRPVLPPVLQAMESWRLAFLAVAVPGPLVALAVLLIRLHPQRGGADAPAAQGEAALSSYFQAHGRTMLCVFGGSGLMALGIAASVNWAPIVAARVFGASTAEVGQGIGLAYLLGTAAGAVLGAAGVKALRRRAGMATPVRVVGIGAVLAALASMLMLTAHSANALYLLFGMQVVALIAGSVLMPTLLQDMTPALLRSRLIAVGTGVTVGLSALSPVLVGALSDLLHGSAHGLLASMAGVGAAAFALSAVVMRWAEKPFVHTVRHIHPGLAQREA
jgi:MFS family permease